MAPSLYCTKKIDLTSSPLNKLSILYIFLMYWIHSFLILSKTHNKNIWWSDCSAVLFSNIIKAMLKCRKKTSNLKHCIRKTTARKIKQCICIYVWGSHFTYRRTGCFNVELEGQFSLALKKWCNVFLWEIIKANCVLTTTLSDKVDNATMTATRYFQIELHSNGANFKTVTQKNICAECSRYKKKDQLFKFTTAIKKHSIHCCLIK